MWGGLILKRANSPPRITARRGGGVTKKMARSLLMDAAGVVFVVPAIGTPPRPREKRMLRNVFLIARPPLLAVMRGGESAILKIVPSLDSSAFFDWSLEPQGEHWVDLGGAPGRYPASNGGGQRNNGHSDKNVQCMSAFEACHHSPEHTQQIHSCNHANREPDCNTEERLTKHEVMDLTWTRAEGHPDADFLRSQRCRIQRHAINAGCGHNQREPAGDCEQTHDESPVGDGVREKRFHRPTQQYSLVGINCGDCISNRLLHLCCWSCRPGDQKLRMFESSTGKINVGLQGFVECGVAYA